MDVDKYLKRIQFEDKVVINAHSLSQLHECHVFHVPFENLDVHFGKPFDLAIDNIYKKVVDRYRGGFCYELNTLFNELLCHLGFKSRIIEARIFDEFGKPGSKYDHMAIIVETDKLFLLDVGFGDLFIKPLEIKDGIQSDGRNQFKIERLEEDSYILSMSSNQIDFNPKYVFYLNEVELEDFFEICVDKQTNPLSYFVKNTVCTKPTGSGRITIFNDKLIEKNGTHKMETKIENDNHLKEILKDKFNVDVG